MLFEGFKRLLKQRDFFLMLYEVEHYNIFLDPIILNPFHQTSPDLLSQRLDSIDFTAQKNDVFN